MEPLSPVLLIGLGAPGGQLARRAAGEIRASRAAWAPLLGVVTLDARGFSALRWGPRTGGDVPEPASREEEVGAEGAGSAPGAAVDGEHEGAMAAAGPHDGSGGELTPGGDDERSTLLVPLALDEDEGALAANAALLRQGHPVPAALAAELRQLCDFSTTWARDAYPRRGGQPGVIVYATLHDSIGSAALVPVLEWLYQVFQRSLADLSCSVQAVLLLPDLFPGHPATAPARSYAALRELECSLEQGRAASNPVWLDRAWLVSARNADDFFIQSSDELSGVLREHVEATLRGLLFLEPTPVPALLRHVKGRRSRFGSLGFARLVFPREAVVEAAVQSAVAAVLHDLPPLAPERPHRDELGAEVLRFLATQPVSTLHVELQQTNEGRSLFLPFAFPPRENHPRDGSFQPRLRAAFATYDTSAALDGLAAIPGRSRTLQAQVATALDEFVRLQMADNRRGCLTRAQGMVAMLTGDESEFLDGEASDVIATVPAVIERLFFDYFEPQFEADRFPGAQERGSRRERVRRLDLEAQSSRRQLERTREQLARLVRPQPGAPQPPPAQPGSEDTREAAEFAADVRAAAEHSVHRREQELAALQADETRLEEELAGLLAEHDLARSELDEIERAIRDPRERRELLERQRMRRLGEIDDLFVEHENSVSGAQAAFQAFHSARLAALWWGAGIALLAVPLVVWGVLRFGRYAAPVIALAAAGGWCYQAGAALLGARRRLGVAIENRDRLRGRLEDEYRAIARFRFDHVLYSNVAEWGERICGFLTDELGGGLRRVREQLVRTGNEARQRSRSIDVPDEESEIDYVLPPGEPALAWAPYEAEAHAAAAAVMNRWPAERLFQEMRSSDRGLQQLERELRTALLMVLAPLATCTLEAFLEQLYPDPKALAARVDRFRRLAAPWGRKVLVLPDEPCHSVDILEIRASTPEGTIARALRLLGSTPKMVASTCDTEAVLLRASLGFAAFQFAGLLAAREEFLSMDDAAREAVSANPTGEVMPSPDLFPPELRESNAEIPALVDEAIACGLAKQDGEGVRFGTRRFPSRELWIDYLDAPRGFAMLRELRSVLSHA